MHRSALFVLALIPLGVRLQSQAQPLFDALQQEMNRSMSGLRMEGQPAPYYIAYAIVDTTRTIPSGFWELSHKRKQIEAEFSA